MPFSSNRPILAPMTAGYGYDEERSLLVVVRNEHDSDDEYREFLQRVDALDRGAAGRHQEPVFIIVTSPGTPAPSARWRREFADAAHRAASASTCALLVTGSAIQRGVLNTIRWLQVRPRGAMQACRTFAEARGLAEAHRHGALPELATLLEVARQDLARAEASERRGIFVGSERG